MSWIEEKAKEDVKLRRKNPKQPLWEWAARIRLEGMIDGMELAMTRMKEEKEDATKEK